MKKRIVAFAVLICLLLGTLPAALAQEENPVPPVREERGSPWAPGRSAMLAPRIMSAMAA